MVKKKDAGVTTIVVVCAMAIIMALSLGLFLTASVLMRTAGKTAALQQCRILAVSFSREIENQLTSQDTVFESRNEEEASKVQDVHSFSPWHYVKQNISDGSWPCYEEQGTPLHAKENAMRTFRMDSAGIAGEIADTQLVLYWTKEKQGKNPEQLVVKTSVTVKEQTCTITDIYELQASGEDYESWKWKHVDKK